MVILGKNPLTTSWTNFESIVDRKASITERLDPSPWRSKLNPFLNMNFSFNCTCNCKHSLKLPHCGIMYFLGSHVINQPVEVHGCAAIWRVVQFLEINGKPDASYESCCKNVSFPRKCGMGTCIAKQKKVGRDTSKLLLNKSVNLNWKAHFGKYALYSS